MASREKKLSVGRKQSSASPVPPKEGVANPETPTKSTVKNESPQQEETQKVSPVKTPKSTCQRAPTIKKLTKKNTAKKNIKMTLIGKNTRANKIRQKIVKTLLNNAKTSLDCKKNILHKNGVTPKRIRRNKVQLAVKQECLEDDKPPTLEPMLPIAEIPEKKPRKRVKKSPVVDEDKKIKTEGDDAITTVDLIIDQVIGRTKIIKRPRLKKIKVEPETETLEDVMNDLSSLIKNEETLEKPKKPVPKKKLEPAKRKAIKKENIENALSKNINIDASARKVIDMLDLNVHKATLGVPIRKRRHSIEKFPISAIENADNFANLSVFSNLPRSISPRSKRGSKMRQSLEVLTSRRSSPYSTRSDSPARILRNGKHRKLKDNLLEGLDTDYTKRRRLCSDFSGSEKSGSKMSGYDSDSSFSDLASLHGTEVVEHKDGETPTKSDLLKKEIFDTLTPSDNLNIKSISNKFTAILQRTLSTETPGNGIVEVENDKNEQNIMDTNSNLFTDLKPELPSDNQPPSTPVKTDAPESDNSIAGSPSLKVPEKSIILDIMKQTFNDVNLDDQERRTTRSSVRRSLKTPEEKIEDPPIPSISTSKFYKSSNEIEAVEPNNEEKEEEVKAPQVEAPIELLDTSDEVMEKVEEISENVVKEDLTNGDPLDTKSETKIEIDESPEALAIKESMLQALGLQSLKAAEEAKLKEKEKIVPKADYTGTLKTVIKLNRCEKKKNRGLKMALQKSSNVKTKVVLKDVTDIDLVGVEEDQVAKVTKESASTSWRSHGPQSSDTAGGHRKSHYSNRSNMDGSSEHTSDGDTGEGEDTGKTLVIPEKASSFSIHPGRLCKDECSYCFGKFGLFDTPCHIAQMKSVERQDKILATEKHLTRDSCLCDACYRHVDRKSNTPSYSNKSSKRSTNVAPGPRQNHCHVLNCNNVAANVLKRKWIIKMRKNVCQVINIDLDNPGLHSIPICEEHYSSVEHLMVCAMCKRRLARNHIHYLGPETSDLNNALNIEGIPVKLIDKPVVCKLCRYFASLILKPSEELSENSVSFFKEYKKRLLHFHDVELMDQAAAEEPIPVPTKEKLEKEHIKKRKKLSKIQNNNDPPILEPQVDIDKSDQSRVPSTDSNSKSRSESPSDYMVDYNTLIPSIAMDCGSDLDMSKREQPKKQMFFKKMPRPESIKEAVEISKKLNKNNKVSEIAVQRLGSNPSISVRQLFPGEEDLGLLANVDFNNVKERTPEGWEKCSSTIQYDLETKQLWQELQKPYGNQSSFLRHLILLEKYFRNGDLVLSLQASNHSINYSESVQNRLRAYDNIASNSIPLQTHLNPSITIRKSNSGIITTNKEPIPNIALLNAANIPKSTPITLSQLNSPSFLAKSNGANKAKNPGIPPGLISLQPGTNKPIAPPLLKLQQQPQKIKFPLTKNWRPNLIPIDPKKAGEKKPGFVQVISGNKPYHITIEDYKRMCTIKRNYDLKQKKIQEAQNANGKGNAASPNYLLKTIVPRKGLMIAKSSSNSKNEAIVNNAEVGENSLEKLEKLESKLSDKSVMVLPKIPKSLTVIPQTVSRKPSRPSSPILMITPKPKNPKS